jgi:hypothetical protein
VRCINHSQNVYKHNHNGAGITVRQFVGVWFSLAMIVALPFAIKSALRHSHIHVRYLRVIQGCRDPRGSFVNFVVDPNGQTWNSKKFTYEIANVIKGAQDNAHTKLKRIQAVYRPNFSLVCASTTRHRRASRLFGGKCLRSWFSSAHAVSKWQ